MKYHKKFNILLKVRKLIAEVLNLELDDVQPKSKIIDELGAESLDIVTMLMEFEDTFQMKIPDEDVESMITVQDAAAYIMEVTKRKED